MFCSQCGKAIDHDSRFCRFCGAVQASASAEQPTTYESIADLPPDATDQPDPAKSDSGLAWIFGGIAAIIFVIFVIGLVSQTPKPSTVTPSEAASDAAANALDAAGGNLEAIADATSNDAAGAIAAVPSQGSWAYSSDDDKVRGGKSYFASNVSTNSVALDPPYDGGSTLRIMVRHSPASGTDVLLVLSSGQLMCPSYEGCHGTVRFDSGPAQYLSFSGAADNSSDTIFVNGAKNFIAKLKRAKKVVIEVEIYQAGRPQFEFDVNGLKWDH